MSLRSINCNETTFIAFNSHSNLYFVALNILRDNVGLFIVKRGYFYLDTMSLRKWLSRRSIFILDYSNSFALRGHYGCYALFFSFARFV